MGWHAIFFILAGANLICMLFVAWLLPETNNKRLSTLNFGKVFISYGKLLRDRSFVGNLIPDTAIRAGMFAYIAGSPFVFIQVFGISESQYGLIFGMNGFGLMRASQINRRLLNRWSPHTILRWSVRTAALMAAVVFIAAWTNAPAHIFLGSIFVFLMTLNFVGPNAMAGALSAQAHQEGTASALYGCLQWSRATFSSYLVGYFHSDSAVPMAGVILACGLVSLIAFRILVPRKSEPRGI